MKLSNLLTLNHIKLNVPEIILDVSKREELMK